MRKILLIVVSMLCFVGLISGCGGITSDKFEGTWVGTKADWTQDFFYEFEISKNGNDYILKIITTRTNISASPKIIDGKKKHLLESIDRYVGYNSDAIPLKKTSDNTLTWDMGLEKRTFTYSEKDGTLIITPCPSSWSKTLQKAKNGEELEALRQKQIDEWKDKYPESDDYKGYNDTVEKK